MNKTNGLLVTAAALAAALPNFGPVPTDPASGSLGGFFGGGRPALPTRDENGHFIPASVIGGRVPKGCFDTTAAIGRPSNAMRMPRGQRKKVRSRMFLISKAR